MRTFQFVDFHPLGGNGTVGTTLGSYGLTIFLFWSIGSNNTV